MEFIHLSVNQQQYLISSENIQEIINYPNVKKIPNSSDLIEGLFNHKGSLVPLISMRKLLNFDSFKTEQLKILEKVLAQHKAWVEDFKRSMIEGIEFKKELDPTKCEFGEWISKMLACLSCNQNGFNDLLKEHVITPHDALHLRGKEILNKKFSTLHEYQNEIEGYCQNTLKGIDILETEIDKLTSAFERVMVYNFDGITVGFTIDSVEKLYDLDEKNFFNSKESLSGSTQFVNFIDHYEIDGKLMFSMKLIKNTILESIEDIVAPA